MNTRFRGWHLHCSLKARRMKGLESNDTSEFLVREPPELHALGCFVHGALAALHTLGAVYNCRRRNWWDVAAHIVAALYDARSVRHHYRTEQIARRRVSAARATLGSRSSR
jgi:hypothetical protein